MIYIYGSNTNASYRHPHSEIVMQRDLALAFNAIGRPAACIWIGPDCVEAGVPHANMRALRPSPDDVLFQIHGLQAVEVAQRPGYEHLRVMRRKLLYTSVAFDRAIMDVWAGCYQHVFLECATHVPDVQAALPGIPVEHCQLGCTLDVDLSALPNPYPSEGRHLFFAGRLGESAIYRMRRLIERMSPNYHLWCACPVIVFPPDVSLPWAGRRGALVQPDEMAPAESDDGKHVQVGGGYAIELMRTIVSRDSRFHPLGALPFGSFWHYQHHAFACLDFGFPRTFVKVPNNCKLLDLVRAGARVAAHEWSPTHYLIDKYAAGASVGYEDTDALLALLESWQPEPLATRRLRGTQAAVGESWLARMPMILSAIDAL